MRNLAYLLLLAAPLIGGCSNDVCASYGGKTCIALEIDGPGGTEVDELDVSATGFMLANGKTFDASHDRKTLPLDVAILPGDAFAGDFSLSIDGLLLGEIVGHADFAETIDVPGRHRKFIVTLIGAALSDADLAGADLTGDHRPTSDLAGADLSGDPRIDGSTPPDLAGTMPPADSVCGTSLADAWSVTTKATSNCDARVVMQVDPAFDTKPGQTIMRSGIDRVAIARAPTGRVAIVYGAYGENGIDDRPLLVSAFVGDTVPPVWTTKSFGGGLGERQGTSPSIAASADGTMDICFLDTSDTGNEVHFATFDNANSFGGPDSVAASLSSRGYVGTALDGAGNIYCAYFNPSDETFKSRVKTGTVWGSALNIHTGGSSTLTDRGYLSLKSADGNVHIAFQNPTAGTAAQPQYATYAAPAWSTVKTVDNGGSTSLTDDYGQSVSLAVFGSRRSFAYYVPQGGTAYNLRVATFDSVSDIPVYTDIATNAVSDLDSARVAMAVDPWGQLHVVYVATSADGTGSLIYLRQYPDGTGGLKWLQDLIDPDAGAGTDTLSLDITVDSRGRPHIVYYSGQTGHLMYATRTDRP